MIKMEAEIKNKCFICNEIIFGTSCPVCSICRQKDAEHLLRAQTFLKSHPNAGLAAIAEGTYLPHKVIQWYFRHGELRKNQHRDITNGSRNTDKSLLIHEKLYGNYIWMEVSGKIDSANALSLEQYISFLIEDEWINIIIDMSAITFFSSTGIRVIMTAYKKLHMLGGSLQIANPSPNVKNVLGMVALDSMLL